MSAFSVQSWAQATETITLNSSKDLQLRFNNNKQSATGASLELRNDLYREKDNPDNNYDQQYGFCGLLGFDLSEIHAKISEGYKVSDLYIQLTNSTKSCDDKLALQPFGNDWEEAQSTTWASMAARIEEATAEISLVSGKLPNGGAKPFELRNTEDVEHYDISKFQGEFQSDALTAYVKNALASSDAGVSFLLVNTKPITAKGELGVFTKDANLSGYGTGTTTQWIWNPETSKWEEGTDTKYLRYQQMLDYFGLTQEQFQEAVAPKLVVTLVETGVKIPEVLPTSADVTSANTIRTTNAKTTKITDNTGSVKEGFYYSTTNDGSIYLGRYDFKALKAIKANLSLLNDPRNMVAVNFSTMDAIEGEVTADYFKNYDVRSSSAKLCHLCGTQTINDEQLWLDNGFKRGVDYIIDVENKAISIDIEGFADYWKSEGTAIALDYSTKGSATVEKGYSGFDSRYDKVVSSGKLQDLFMYSTAGSCRAAVSEVTLYFRDNSSVTVPVKAMNGYEITEKNMGAAFIKASSELNGDPITSVTLGDVALTADNAALLAELEAAGIDATAETVSYDLTVNSHGNATLCLPFAATLPTGVEAYTLNYTSGEKAQATAVDELAANTPVFIKAAQGTYTFETANASIEMADEPVAGALVSGYASKFVPAGAYVFQNQAAGAAFYKVAADNTINFKPFRAYLQAEAAGANALFIDWGEVTGVDATVTETAEADGPVYTLQGVKVADSLKDAKLARGLYIVNGKTKVIR